MSTDHGYYRQPTLHGDTVVFVCETDLWSVPVAGGVARRLTAHQVDAAWPRFSPDGQWIAYAAMEEGASEIYVMRAEGGIGLRLTFQGASSYVCGFSPDGKEVVYASLAMSPFAKMFQLWAISIEGGAPRRLNVGPARRIAYGKDGTVVISRREQEIARWKRYRGGTRGDLWVDAQGTGAFTEILTDFPGNLGSPCVVGDRIYVVADHEGYGNVYSLGLDGKGLKRETDHRDYYARALSDDGRRLVYQCGAELYVLDQGKSRKIQVAFHSSKPQTVRKFSGATRHFTGFALHPEGHSVLVTTRGKPYAMGNWEREVVQIGTRDGVRYRLASWLPDGKRIVAISDEGGEEALEIHALPEDDGTTALPERLDGLDVGRIRSLFVSPTGDHVVAGNHRFELVHIDLAAKTAKILDRSLYEDVKMARFSPDGRFVAYVASQEFPTSQIFVVELATGAVNAVTRPVGNDHSVAWDPEGRYLYVLSNRSWDPVYDSIVFDLSFPKGGRAYAIALRKDVESPLHPSPRPLEAAPPPKKDKDAPAPAPFSIDFEGIDGRIVELPFPDGRYGRILATKSKVFLTEFPVEGSLSRGQAEPAAARLHVFDLETLKHEVFVEGISTFGLSRDGKTMAYRHKDRLRVVKTAAKPDSKETKAGRASGWIDLDRIRVSVEPRAEWRQMLREMWRLQRDHFWDVGLSSVDWNEVYHRYQPILERVATRSEFSDLAWELQGELGTSHAYEYGGDHRWSPYFPVGRLGVDFAWDEDAGAWRFDRIVRGDPWDRGQDSPLGTPGANVVIGEHLLAIDGMDLDARTTPGALLVHKANVDVALTVRSAQGAKPRRVIVRPLATELPLRYRAWVEKNREKVREQSSGRIGYVHIPDMGARGYAEFFRYYPLESGRDGLVVDVRYNGGGHVSQLLLEKLARKRLMYSVSHHLAPIGEPMYAVEGPIVCLTNEFAGSDGDIFSHSFKMMKLGQLVGKRTWGGVIGIDSRNALVDGTMVTQPEYATWFKDVGWGVENYGTDPDLEIDVAPQEYARGEDTQLTKAVELALASLARTPPPRPDFGRKPDLRRPSFPE